MGIGFNGVPDLLLLRSLKLGDNMQIGKGYEWLCGEANFVYFIRV